MDNSRLVGIPCQSNGSEHCIGDDFDMILPCIDSSGELVEYQRKKTANDYGSKFSVEMSANYALFNFDEKDISQINRDEKKKSKIRGNKSGITTKGSSSEIERKLMRRKQIAAASRTSRIRRKHELEGLRIENMKLRIERSAAMSKMSELEIKVDSLHESGNNDMFVENALLRAQLEEHKRFVAHFKHICDGVPSTAGARYMIYQQGSMDAQNHVLALVAQSVVDSWTWGTVPPEARIPFQNLSFCYKYKTEFGEKHNEHDSYVPRRRLNIRVDLMFPGFNASLVSDFVWNSYSNSDIQERLYRKTKFNLTQLANETPDKDTKLVYYRERLEPAEPDQDWAVICSRRVQFLPKSSFALPRCTNGVAMNNYRVVKNEAFQGSNSPGLSFDGRTEIGSINSSSSACKTSLWRDHISQESRNDNSFVDNKTVAMVLALSTTTLTSPQSSNVNCISSMVLQGAMTWDEGGDAMLTLVFSFPDSLKIKGLEGFTDIVTSDGRMGIKFAEILKEFNEMLGEEHFDDLLF